MSDALVELVPWNMLELESVVDVLNSAKLPLYPGPTVPEDAFNAKLAVNALDAVINKAELLPVFNN
jgi:hypothetical protein